MTKQANLKLEMNKERGDGYGWYLFTLTFPSGKQIQRWVSPDNVNFLADTCNDLANMAESKGFDVNVQYEIGTATT